MVQHGLTSFGSGLWTVAVSRQHRNESEGSIKSRTSDLALHSIGLFIYLSSYLFTYLVSQEVGWLFA